MLSGTTGLQLQRHQNWAAVARWALSSQSLEGAPREPWPEGAANLRVSQEHRKGCVTPQHSSCSPQQLSGYNPLFNPKGPIYTTPAAYSVHSAMNCPGHCSHLHSGCTKTEKLVPHRILAPSSMFVAVQV